MVLDSVASTPQCIHQPEPRDMHDHDVCAVCKCVYLCSKVLRPFIPRTSLLMPFLALGLSHFAGVLTVQLRLPLGTIPAPMLFCFFASYHLPSCCNVASGNVASTKHCDQGYREPSTGFENTSTFALQHTAARCTKPTFTYIRSRILEPCGTKIYVSVFQR